MKISEIRRVIESLNWNRHDLTGATREEFRKMDVRERLMKHVNAVKALDIPARFADDKQDAAEAIERALIVIKRWEDARAAVPAVAPVRGAVPSTLVSYSGRA